MKVVFRTDASRAIGTGHVMRCLTLAETLRQGGAECSFICREHEGHLLDMIRERGFAAVGLPVLEGENPDADALAHSGWLGAGWQADAKATADALDGGHADWIVVDHYALDRRWEQALRPHCDRILVIDDIADRNHDCDMLLDQNLVENADGRYSGLVPETCGLMLGPDFALLQPRYAELHRSTPPREGPVRRILVSFGGADSPNLTGMALEAFLSLGRADVHMDVVLGGAHPHADASREQAEGHANVTLYDSLPSLADLMVQADVGIGAGGATSWERCCLGLPSLVVTLADNQKPIAKELHRRGIIEWLGHAGDIEAQTVAGALKRILDEGIEPSWSERCMALVDGGGSARVSGFMTLSLETPFLARAARLDDEKWLPRWGPELKDTFRSDLRNPEHARLLVIETDDGVRLGLVRCVAQDGRWSFAAYPDPCAFVPPDRLSAAALLEFRNKIPGVQRFAPTGGRVDGLLIAICSDASSWMNAHIPDLIVGWTADGQAVDWGHDAKSLMGGDLCFYLSYGRIVDAHTRSRFRHNLVVHASDLPNGRGWSPMTWRILEGASSIPLTLLEASEKVDSGQIYLQDSIELEGTELCAEWRKLQADRTVALCRQFLSEYPEVVSRGRTQRGEPSFYPRRRVTDSELDLQKSLIEQFNLLRVADNESYPAYFHWRGRKYYILTR